ncbi:GAP family protein [Mycobacterium sp.]|uniref:GAP family protein n=1 Tax=Mycobacterium sp. TaxID=1785 RepID=UPI003BAD01DF
MWTSVLVMGLFMATDPIRLGLALVLVTRRRPMLNLLAFWLGGMVAGVGLAVAVLVLLRDVALAAIEAGVSAIADVRSAVVIFSGGRLQITVGVIVLMIAANMVARQRGRVLVGAGAGGGSGVAVASGPPGLVARVVSASQSMLAREGFVWPAFVVGLTSSAPPVETVGALTVIMASEAALGMQVSAFLVFIVLVLTVIEVPLLAYLAAPRQTEVAMLRLDRWLRVHRRRITLSVLLAVGTLLLVQGVVGL